MSELSIPQVELDKQDFLNEATQPILQDCQNGGLEEVYRRYDGREMRRPEVYFMEQSGLLPAKGFPLLEFNGLVDCFNQKLSRRELTPGFLLSHIERAYGLAGRKIPSYIKPLLGGMTK